MARSGEIPPDVAEQLQSQLKSLEDQVLEDEERHDKEDRRSSS